MKVRTFLNLPKLKKRFSGDTAKAQFLLDQQIMKDSNFYAPVDRHQLERSVIPSAGEGRGVLVWNVPYAKKQYYMYPNKSKDVNPNARSHWFEWAKKINLKKWLRLVKNEYAS